MEQAPTTEICYDETTGWYAMYFNGGFEGYAFTQWEAKNGLDDLVCRLILQGQEYAA